MPGQANTVSVSTAPPAIWPSWMPAKVMTGSSALRSTWVRITRLGLTPLARAVFTKSIPMTSSIDARVRRTYTAMKKQPRVIVGRTRCWAMSAARARPVSPEPTVSMPKAGNQPSTTENSRMPISDNQNSGVAYSNSAPVMTELSIQRRLLR